MLHGDLGSANHAIDPARACHAQPLLYELHDPRMAKD
jgi:hypothetical protein